MLNHFVENCGLCGQKGNLPFLRGFKLLCEICEGEYRQIANRQRIALYNACRYAADRRRNIFSHHLIICNAPILTVLTVDDFGGVPCWHVSGELTTKPLNFYARFGNSELKKIGDFLQLVLSDVGTGSFRRRNSVNELHFFKTLSEEESQELRRL